VEATAVTFPTMSYCFSAGGFADWPHPAASRINPRTTALTNVSFHDNSPKIGIRNSDGTRSVRYFGAGSGSPLSVCWLCPMPLSLLLGIRQQPSHTKNGLPSTMILIGGPIEPSRLFFSKTAQYRWARPAADPPRQLGKLL